jgi:hypothetical protein
MIRINQSSRNLLCAAVVAVCSFTPVTALTLADFNSKLNPGERVTYLTGSVSMLMFNYAAQGNREKASCINNWYFKSSTANGQRVEPRGPAELEQELARVSKLDSTYHVEEIIPDRINQVCRSAAERLNDTLDDADKATQAAIDRLKQREAEAKRRLDEHWNNAIILSDGRHVFVEADGGFLAYTQKGGEGVRLTGEAFREAAAILSCLQKKGTSRSVCMPGR